MSGYLLEQHHNGNDLSLEGAFVSSSKGPVVEGVRARPTLKCSTFSKRYFAATLRYFTVSMSVLASYDHLSTEDHMFPKSRSSSSTRLVSLIRKRCACEKCATCLDNMRWELRFQLKFGQQEREYYSETRRVVGVSANGFLRASMYR
jgi:hypothetical protein